MATFQQASDGDLALTLGRFPLVSGAVQKAQKIANTLGLVAGEWFLDTRVGIPYFENILGIKNPPLSLIRQIFTRGILTVEGIESVQVEVDFDASTRELDWSFVAITDEGVEITGGLGVPPIVGVP